MTEQKVDFGKIGDQLKTWLQAKMPDAVGLELGDLKSPGAGVSNETYFLEVQWKQDGQSHVQNFVLRWPPSGFRVFPDYAYDMELQHKLIQRLGETGVSVPPVHWLETDVSVIGVPFYVMERVEGWVPSDFPPYHIRGPLFEANDEDKEKVWWNTVQALADIHTLDWRRAGLDFLGVPAGGKDYMHGQITYYEEVFALNGETLPEILQTTRDWLSDNSFAPKHLSLCWGDARLGNVIIKDYEVAAVLDWEMACIGDPESDLGWFAHMDWATSVGRSTKPFPRLGGLPDMAETITRYEKMTSRKVKNLHYYEVFATWRMAILFTRIEQDEQYIARSGNAKGFITWTHFEKLKNLLNL